MYVYNLAFTAQKNTEELAMEEIMSMVLHGCKLAKDLEANLATSMAAAATASSQASLISRSCDEIVQTFLSVKERVDQQQGVFYHHHHHHHDHDYRQMLYSAAEIDPSLQEWLRSSVTQAMELFHQTQTTPFETALGGGSGGRDSMEGCSSTPQQQPLRAAGRGGGGGQVQGPILVEVSADSSGGRGGGSSSSSQRHRRSDNARTVRVPTPQFGNTEIPPEDGYTWRKYGQKEILNSKFPRSYYRCTHQKLYHCPAKKQVQRLDDDPYTFEVTYRDDHTCHMSSTAPSAPRAVVVAPPPEVTQEMTQAITVQPSSTTLGRWLSMEVLGTGGSGSSGSSGRGGGAGPSSAPTIRYDREGEHQYLNVANMADAMFNSGSSSSNSMDFLFRSMEDKKWQPEEKKN